MATILVHIALVAYAAAAAAFLTWLVRPQTRLARAGRALLAIGVVVHFAAFGVSLGVAGAGLGVPAWKGGQLFSLLAAVTVAGYLVLDFRYELPGPSIWPILTALAVTFGFIGSLFNPWWLVPSLVLSFITFVGWFWPSQVRS